DSWGPQGGPTQRVSGYVDGVQLELIWWARAYAEEQVDALFTGEPTGAADALAHGVALRTCGLLAAWQERLRAYPPELAAEQIEDAFTEPDLRRALLVMTELQLETVRLAPSGPNVDRARIWLAAAAELLRVPQR